MSQRFERPLPSVSMTGSEHIGRQFRVVHARSSQGAGRPLSLALRPFTHRRQLCVRQRPLGRIASMPTTVSKKANALIRREAIKQAVATGALKIVLAAAAARA